MILDINIVLRAIVANFYRRIYFCHLSGSMQDICSGQEPNSIPMRSILINERAMDRIENKSSMSGEEVEFELIRNAAEELRKKLANVRRSVLISAG